MSPFDDLGSIPPQMLASGSRPAPSRSEHLTLALVEIEPDCSPWESVLSFDRSCDVAEAIIAGGDACSAL